MTKDAGLSSRSERELADEIEAQFMRPLPPASYPSEWIFSVKMDFRDWHRVVKTLRAWAVSERGFSLRHLQKHLPWTIPYSSEFKNSERYNGLRPVGHDVLHVMKSLGRIAAEVEGADHARPRRLSGVEMAKEVADLVICALHIAKLEGFDLQDAVIQNSEARNAAAIPPESNER